MTAIHLVLIILTASSGITYLAARAKGNDRLKYIFKPLTTFLIIAIAFMQEPATFTLYKILVITGLFFALVGDVLLMLPKDRFVAGLSAFAIAVISFTLAFAIDPGPYFGWGYLIPGAVYAIMFLAVFLRRTGKLTIPIIIYVALLILFFWQATGRAWYIAEDGVLMAFLGSGLFILSDTLLAYYKFIKPLRFVPVFSMSFYWIALLLIALSV